MNKLFDIIKRLLYKKRAINDDRPNGPYIASENIQFNVTLPDGTYFMYMYVNGERVILSLRP